MPKLHYTNDISDERKKMAIYGYSGVGKTSAAGTFADPSKVLILSTEHGTMSLRRQKIAYMVIKTMRDFNDALEQIKKPQCPFDIIYVDSISDFAEIDLRERTYDENGRPRVNDKRLAYNETADYIKDVFRQLRELDKDVVCVFKAGRVNNSYGVAEYSPVIPGQKASQDILFYFDEVIAMRVVKNADGTSERQFICQPDGEYQAKDRSGMLDTVEPPSFAHIMAKIDGVSEEPRIKLGSEEKPKFMDGEETKEEEEEVDYGE